MNFKEILQEEIALFLHENRQKIIDRAQKRIRKMQKQKDASVGAEKLR